MSVLARRLDRIEPLASVAAGSVQETVYGVVDRVDNIDGALVPHFCRKWKGTIGNMRETDEEPTIYIIEKLEPCILKHKKYKCLWGGRAGTKSIMAMDSMIGDVNACGSKVYVLRERMKSLKESIYAGIKDRVGSLSISGFTPVPSQWEIRHKTGGVFTFGGMQNIIDMKGSFNYKYFLMEEAARTRQETIDVLGPTLRNTDGAELWYIWNPESSNDPMSKEFIVPFQADLDKSGYYEDDYHLIIKVGFEDNPWFEHDKSLREEYKKDSEKVANGRMSKSRYNWIWHGAFNDDVENCLIEADWFDACVDAHIKLGFEARGAKVITHDPSDVGNDPKGLAMRHGVVFTMAEEIEAENGNRAMDIACEIAEFNRADKFGWDCDGMGALLRDQAAANFKDKNIQTYMFKGSEGPHNPDSMAGDLSSFNIRDPKRNKDVYKNKRSQNYTSLAQRMYRTYLAVEDDKCKYQDPDDLISFSSDIKDLSKLRSELCRLPIKPGPTIQLYSKEEMRKGILMPDGSRLQIPSPNLADCVMMSFDKAATMVVSRQAYIPKPIKTFGR